MIIHSKFKEYAVIFKTELSFLKNYFDKKDTYFVIDRNVYQLYKDTMFDGLHQEKYLLLDAVEEKKNIQTVLDICEEMTKLSQKRNIHLISVGGGITQDITGLVANILYRGIRWTFVPTTLLAACDSCIGGKTSLNYKHFKNLLGTFYPPDEILICASVLKSLTEKDFQSGLGEVVKFNVMYGDKGIERLENDIQKLLVREEDIVSKYIHSSLEFKKTYIEEDEFDKGIRIHLNFAHTFGHAIESVTEYAIPHGTAVAIGTIIANEISNKRGYLSNERKERMEKLLLKIINIDIDFEKLKAEQIIFAIKKDKKQTDDRIKAVLFDENMKLKVYSDIQIHEIEDAVQYLTELL